MISVRKFGELPSGETARIYHLENQSGAYAEVTDYGCILVKLCVPDRDGNLTDVVLGYDELEKYFVNGCYFGAVLGRNGNRVAQGRFMIGDREILLARNENENNLHSGPDGFEKKLWKVEEQCEKENRITFSRLSPDGENGFPGNFQVSVSYEFTEDNQLKITYGGVCDEDTVGNFTNHSYFNLAGEGSGTVLDQKLTILASRYTPVRSDSIPVGETAAVKGTPLDFTKEKSIGQDVEADFQQLKYTGGFDHNFVVDGYEEGVMKKIACACSSATGIQMEVYSDRPCVQFYGGNFIKDEAGKNGHIYRKRDGFCLETQVEPNAVNVPAFHSPVVKKGERYHSATTYAFSVRK